jgi:hypothetical protein
MSALKNNGLLILYPLLHEILWVSTHACEVILEFTVQVALTRTCYARPKPMTFYIGDGHHHE